MQNNIPVLCTRPLDEHLIAEAHKKNISIDVIPFIDTVPVETVEIQQEIENAVILSATVVFTSMNAVEAVAGFTENEPPAWRIYCIGNTTRELTEKYFGADLIAGTAPDATQLAELIVAESEGENVIFFCGDMRRPELPDILQENDIEVTEIVVYETILLPQKINKEYAGILFFSPSAAESFFSVNKINNTARIFSIGKTTAETIRKYTGNNIIVSDTPEKQSLVFKMIEYFGG